MNLQFDKGRKRRSHSVKKQKKCLHDANCNVVTNLFMSDQNCHVRDEHGIEENDDMEGNNHHD